VYDNRKRSLRAIAILQKHFNQDSAAIPKGKKAKATISLESRIDGLNAELNKLTKENDGLHRVINEYNGIQHEYDALKHGMTKNYKVKNYPGYDKQKPETSSFQKVFDTENAVASYAYEKFLKPVLAIMDNNKNNPAKMSTEDMNRLLDLLISLSLLYIEYLYLRVGELSIGGKMVERIQGLSNGNGIDPLLLRKLDVQHGSRALVLKMILNKLNLHHLSYPVFDETDLNQ
jgi:molecular chaperone GrpE (heat shock protein)